ncbi:MAG: hisA/hisF family protein [Planctomycetaceae bacterium]|nr:hisA/hisF family protein [Planctomycetaceae bacterium]
MPPIIPVIDILNGVVVRGVAGKRSEYKPIVSRLTDRTDVLGVAEAFRQHFHVSRLYVADLDAILGGSPNLDAYRSLGEAGFQAIVDAGISETSQASLVLDAGAEAVIAGLETCPGPQFLADIVREFGDRVIFSLDMKHGEPMTTCPDWVETRPFDLAAQAINFGIVRLIILDLAQVGVGQGLSTVPLCHSLLEQFPNVRLITGGGIRNDQDLQSLENLHLEGVLVASALHNGDIPSRTK